MAGFQAWPIVFAGTAAGVGFITLLVSLAVLALRFNSYLVRMEAKLDAHIEIETTTLATVHKALTHQGACLHAYARRLIAALKGAGVDIDPNSL